MKNLFEMQELTLKKHMFYIMFLEMNKMITKTLLDVKCKNFKCFAIDLIEAIKAVALSVELSSETNIPEYSEYVTKLVSIFEKYSADPENPISETGKVNIIPEQMEEYQNDLETLFLEYKSVLEARQNEVEEIKKFMDTDITVSVPVISFDSIPEEVTAEQIKYLRYVTAERYKA